MAIWSRDLILLERGLSDFHISEDCTKSYRVMVSVCRLLLFAALLLCLQAQLSVSQHWSHGWYPGGKREVNSYSSPEMSGEIKLCEAGECSYVRPLRSNILKSILLNAFARELQKRK